ncbi:hypothetical protein [uncultured Tateyamaria sp.]|uniref:hypothetical protein n=1 Tax=uncultured Tateyamaria sp. TaxID=455651 RepID=UPI00260CAEB2|nr:hypothetical protein [uncultured Tateyamaria sp.]
MKTIHISVAAAVVCASAAFAFDLSNVKTKEMEGLIGPTAGAKLKPKVIATQPLESEGIAELAGRNLRTRFWAIGGPDGIVPIHGHEDRPAVFTVASGEIYEYSSLEDKPILHKTGGLAKEEGKLAHWWHNAGSETVHLIAFDLQPVAKDFSAVKVGPVPAQTSYDLPVSIGADHDLLGVVDIGAHFGGAYGNGWALTTYRATIVPGGMFPDFTGPGEPLQVFVWKGEVVEHRSDMAEPQMLTERTGSNLANGATAYWENTGTTPAELYFGVIEPLTEVAGIEPVGVLAHGEH